MNQTEGLIAQEQLERFVEQRVQSGVSVVVETVGRNGLVRSLVPTRSL
jgi:fructose-specific phosphotransferase system component IIB